MRRGGRRSSGLRLVKVVSIGACIAAGVAKCGARTLVLTFENFNLPFKLVFPVDLGFNQGFKFAKFTLLLLSQRRRNRGSERAAL